MNKKTKLSILLALLMVVSTFSVGSVNADDGCSALEGEPAGNLEVVKKIWNGTDWVDEYTAEIGEHVTFNITITYTAGCGYKATNIVVVDTFDITGTLAYVMEYTDQYPPSEAGAGGVWNLTKDHGIELWDPSSEGHPQSVSIYFNVTFTCGCGELVNTVTVDALETCCQQPLYGEDQATVTVECDEPCEPEIEVIKKVWDGNEWADEVHDLRIGQTVRFKIDIIYHACDDYVIKNMIVQDILPCCLEYVDGSSMITTTGTGSAQPADITVSPDKKEIIWDWTYNNEVTLHGNDSLIIEFDSSFEKYCELDENCVYVEAWGCSGPTFTGEDCVLVNCTKPDNKFDKTVVDGKNEYQEINTSVGETLKFKLAFTYYGETKIFDSVKFVDYLPCILEYADNAAIAYYYGNSAIGATVIPDVSDDGKTIWYNLTSVNLSDGETIAFTFDALVNGSTGGGCSECGCSEAINTGCIELWDCCCDQEPYFSDCDELVIRSEGNCPPSEPFVYDDAVGEIDETLEFTVTTKDHDGDKVRYMIDWGDGTTPTWESTYHNSGAEIQFTHSWSELGEYEIVAKAQDEHGSESDWTAHPCKVTITPTPPPEIDLGVTFGKFSRATIKADIKNKGTEDLTGITYVFNATGGILKRVKVNANGTVDLNTGQTKTVETGANSVGFGIGKISGTIKLAVEDYEKTVSFEGFLLGKMVFISEPITI